MRILSLGLDRSALDKNSKLSKRISEYKKIVDLYDAVVPESKNKIIGLIKICSLSGKLLKKEKYDLITVQDQYYLALLGWFLARKFKIGLELQIHGLERYCGIRKLLAKFVIPKADAIRAVSQRLKRQLIEEFGAREEKITVVPIFVERVTRNGERVMRNGERVTRNDRKFVFLTVGRLVAVKNIGMQIEAMKEVVRVTRNEKRGIQVELWIVGDGPERKNLALLVTRYSLQDYIKFWGWQEEVGKFYEQADAFLLTSNYEGWGMAVIEAASYGLPIIMTDVGCAGEVIKNGESGIVIPVGDKEKLKEAMLKVMEDADLRNRLEEGAQEAIKKLPTKEETLRLYKESWGKAHRRYII